MLVVTQVNELTAAAAEGVLPIGVALTANTVSVSDRDQLERVSLRDIACGNFIPTLHGALESPAVQTVKVQRTLDTLLLTRI